MRKEIITMDEQTGCFIENVGLFNECPERILNYDKISHAEFPIGNNVAFVSDKYMKHSCIGAYLKWWQTCPQSVEIQDDVTKAYMYQFTGNAITGKNICNFIVPGMGEYSKEVKQFGEVWRTFFEINKKFMKNEVADAATVVSTVKYLLKLKTFLHNFVEKLNELILDLRKESNKNHSETVGERNVSFNCGQNFMQFEIDGEVFKVDLDFSV